MKTNKSFSKRIKITKNGKLKTMAKGQNHYNSRENNAAKMNKKKDGTINIQNKVISRVIPGVKTTDLR